MRLAVPARGGELDSALEARFGRCECFIIVDTHTGSFAAVANPAAQASGGAGVEAAKLLASLGVEGVIARDIGPNASRVLDSAGVRCYPANGKTVREVAQAASRLSRTDDPEPVAKPEPPHQSVDEGRY